MTITTLVLSILVCVVLALTVALSRSRAARRSLEMQLHEMERVRDEAREESKAKDLFVQNMSHEVRTPLNAVVGFAQLLAMPPDYLTDQERDEYTQHIQHNSNMLTMLIDDILNISDVKAGNYSITLNDHQLNAMCNAAIASVKYRINPNIKLAYETVIPDSYVIHTDARRVQQILINYLTNAIKHTGKGQIILTTSLEENPGMLTFAVTDTGEGVPAEQADNVFRRFTKLNDYVQGTGLGLNICMMLAERLNGKVFLDTKYTGGARFVFCLPITEQ